MGRKANASEDEEVGELNDDPDGVSTPLLVFSSDDDDDDEANQDLSLKIVEKAMRMREAKLSPNDAVLNGIDCVDSPLQQPELVVTQTDAGSDRPEGIDALEVIEKERMTKLVVESGDQSVIIAAEQEVEEIIKTTEKHESVEASAVQIGDNIVLRKLLRGPRYFDPPDSSWGACYNCGEEGHAAVNCTAARRQKPCYICGGLGHNAKQCTKAQDCFICKKGGHRAKDCPEKHTSASKSLMVCLKCGNSGHDMFSCMNDYSSEDLKEIQCYVCKAFGHLCCANIDDATPVEVSCYRCGQLGHTGLACSRLRGETTSTATPSSCYRCGEGGHFARECTSSVKAGKKSREFSNTKNRRSYKENDYKGHRSAPHDLGMMHKKKRPLIEDRGFTTPKKSKSRGGWMRELPTEERGFSTPKKSRKSRGGWTTEHPREENDFQFQSPKKSKSRGGWTSEHPGEFSSTMSKRSRWKSPGTPSARSTDGHSHSYGGGSRRPSSKSSNAWKGQQPEASNSQGSAKSFHHSHRYSASRFANSSSDGHRRSNWW